MLKVERAGQPLVCHYNWTKRIRKISVVSISNIKRDIAVVTAKRLPVISRGRRYHVITRENRNGFPNCHLRQHVLSPLASRHRLACHMIVCNYRSK